MTVKPEPQQALMFSRGGAPILETSQGDPPPIVEPVMISKDTTGWPAELEWNRQRFTYDPGLTKQHNRPAYRAVESL